MNHNRTSHMSGIRVFVFAVVVGLSLISVMPVLGHGGKNHAQETFSAFQAVQNATQLYARLLASGKLPEVWKFDLKTIKISTRTIVNKFEYIVQFETAKDNPSSVYFFYGEDGAYSGSNFTGE